MTGPAIRSLVKPSEYHDSVSLMLVARTLTNLAGIQDAAVVMASEANKSILASAGLLTDQARTASANDLVIVVSGADASIVDAALQEAETLLTRKNAPGATDEFHPRTVRSAVSLHPEANVAVVSVAGQYAADLAWEALRRGLHVLLFSDHVSIEDEISLKEYARDRRLLLMGPGAGTTILNHVALGFANVVPLGPIGIASAAGTGLQEVSSLLARRGSGISQGIGVGGRDLSHEVGGIMMLEVLKALQDDVATQVIAVISKPPAEEVSHAILKQAAASEKPTVVCFLGKDVSTTMGAANIIPAHTLEECALLAVRIARSESPDIRAWRDAENARLKDRAKQLKRRLQATQRYVRGLFSGGTLCHEAQVVWQEMPGLPVVSNAPLPGNSALENALQSHGNTAVDLGEEEFTSGRPHPMIDNSLRIRRLRQEAGDPEVAAIMLDVVLGYGAHPDPASELGPAAAAARDAARSAGRDLVVVASVTGTEDDPQGLGRSVATLEKAGVIVCDSNAAAARLTGMLVSK